MFQSFFEWQNECIRNTEPESLMLCPECEGECITLRECECCGHEKETGCELCDMTGEVVFGKLSFTDQKKCFNRMDYNELLAKDVKALADWYEDPLFVVKYGFAIATDIRSFAYKKCDIVRLCTGNVLACI